MTFSFWIESIDLTGNPLSHLSGTLEKCAVLRSLQLSFLPPGLSLPPSPLSPPSPLFTSPSFSPPSTTVPDLDTIDPGVAADVVVPHCCCALVRLAACLPGGPDAHLRGLMECRLGYSGPIVPLSSLHASDTCGPNLTDKLCKYM